MPKLHVKSFANPDVRRPLQRADGSMVNLGEQTVGKGVFAPGWRWSVDLGPVTGTASCPLHHLGYSISGRVHVRTDDGQTLDIGPDSAYEIPAGHDAWVVGDEPWVTVEWTSSEEFGVGAEGSGTGVIATLVFTDIVDSTALAERLGQATWRDLLAKHNTGLRRVLNAFHGREVKTTGDGFLVAFDSASRACRAALSLVAAAQEAGVPIRVGVHTGEVHWVADDVRGLAVHVAARVMALAGPAEVMTSATTADLAAGAGLEFEDAGEHELKGVTGKRRLYRLNG
jgi:class 3 adenylate cyclase